MLLRGEPGVDFVHILGLIFVVIILLNIGLSLSQSVQEGLMSMLVVLLAVGVIIFFTSNTMYEWGKSKSAVFAGVFVATYIGLHFVVAVLANA